MERIHSINPDRILWCCSDFGVGLDQLARDTSISLSTLQRVVSGEEDAGLSFKQLSRVAAYFGRGVLFFLEDAPLEPEQVHTSAFRTIANQKPELSTKLRLFIERVEQQRSIYLSLAEELGQDSLVQFTPPDLETDDIPASAAAARKWLGLGDTNNFESYRTAVEKKGILVFRTNGYNGKWQIASDSSVMGFALYDEKCPVIVVRKMRVETRQAFTLMHELGHLLLHRESSVDDEEDIASLRGAESEANSFAGHILVPPEYLRTINMVAHPGEASLFDHWLEPYRRAWGVSTEVILRRLLTVGKLSQQEYAAYRAWNQSLPKPAPESAPRMFRHREPKHLFGDGFVRAVLDALGDRKISLSKASTYLDGLKLNDIHELERHYASL